MKIQKTASLLFAGFLLIGEGLAQKGDSTESFKESQDSSNQLGFVLTWQTGIIGLGGMMYTFGLEYMDRFLVEFLRVNEEACEKRFALPKPRNEE